MRRRRRAGPGHLAAEDAARPAGADCRPLIRLNVYIYIYI